MTQITFQHQLSIHDITDVRNGRDNLEVTCKLDEVQQKRVVAEQEHNTLIGEIKDRGFVVLTRAEAEDMKDDIEAGECLVQMMEEASGLWESNPEEAAKKMTHIMFVATGKKLQFAGALAA
jgi:hypothetical protein